jgi:hypothetical protein
MDQQQQLQYQQEIARLQQMRGQQNDKQDVDSDGSGGDSDDEKMFSNVRWPGTHMFVRFCSQAQRGRTRAGSQSGVSRPLSLSLFLSGGEVPGPKEKHTVVERSISPPSLQVDRSTRSSARDHAAVRGGARRRERPREQRPGDAVQAREGLALPLLDWSHHFMRLDVSVFRGTNSSTRGVKTEKMVRPI